MSLELNGAAAEHLPDIEQVKDDLIERIRDRDYYMMMTAWRHHGGDPSFLSLFDIWAKSPMMWAESKPDLWLIYMCILLENNQVDAARKVFHKYRVHHGEKLVENYLPLAPFVAATPFSNDEIRKAAFVHDCLKANEQARLFESVVAGKARVAIVGNGPSEMGKGKGAEIDSHDIVIRFNNFATAGFEADYGSKTDIWVRGSGGDDIVDRVDADQFKLIVWEADYMHFPIHFDNLDIMVRYLAKDRRKCTNFSFKDHIDLREASGISFPSSGLVAFWKLYNLIGVMVHRVSLYGFSFLEANPNFHHPHYFTARDTDDARMRSAVHHPEIEAQFMRRMLNGEIVTPNFARKAG